jgi:murein DD-endopeptidase MepM/ murein hydrolase activator NlpD
MMNKKQVSILRSVAVMAGILTLFSGVSFARHFSVSIRSNNGSFVTAENGGGGIVNANHTNSGEFETFTLLDLNDGELNDRDPVAIKTVNGHFFSAVNGGGGQLLADKTALVTWETFIIERITVRNSDTLILNGDRVAFKSFSKNYMSAVNGGGGVVDARPLAVGNAERFTVVFRGEPQLSKLSGPFTAPQMIIPFPLGVDETPNPTGDIRKCKNSYLGQDFPNCYRGHEGTDFGLSGGFVTMNFGSIDIYTVAAGKVVAISDGNPDRCYYKFPPPPSNSRTEDFIYCPNDPNNAKRANFVAVLQDDGAIAYYYHMKRESIVVSVGSRVDCGQYLGKVGSSGISAAPHLHLTLQTVPRDKHFPSTADEFDSMAGDRSQATMINPYAPMLWRELIGRVPRKTCGNNGPTRPGNPAAGDFSQDLGQSCTATIQCKLTLTCQNGACRRVGVPPGGHCDNNQFCGPRLHCDSHNRCVF